MRPGSSMRWDALIAHATGEPLTVDHLADWLARLWRGGCAKRGGQPCCS